MAVEEPNASVQIDEIARRVVELLADESPARLVPAAAVGGALGAPTRWVEDHAAELGAVWLRDDLGEGLRFDLRRVVAVLSAGKEPGRLPRSRDRRRAASRAERHRRAEAA